MCSEARGLRGWPRTTARWLVLITAATLAAAAFVVSRGTALGSEPPTASPSPISPDEPLAASLSLRKAAEFLDAVALDWTRKRQCGTCHTNYAYLIARPALADRGRPSAAMAEIREFFEDRAAHWDDAEKAAKPRWDTEVVATAAALALNDAATTGKLHPRTRQALDRIWTLQKPDGSWSWLKCGWPPYEHDDYYGAVFAALGVGSAPEGYAQTEAARTGLERLRSFLKSNPPPDLHHKTFLLWASMRLDGLITAGDREATAQELRGLQRPDGGWSLPSLGDWKRRDGTPNDKQAPSDGYATGLVVYVLRQSGAPADDPALERGVAWLRTHQRASGRWFTRSLNNDKAHYISNAGTGFAVMAIQACSGPES
jgi:squalene-hopene/tetraprenyl-beta-curcumene cyclase